MEGQVVILNRVIKVNPIKKVIFNQDLKECKGVCHVNIWGRILGREKSQCEGLCTGVGLMS